VLSALDFGPPRRERKQSTAAMRGELAPTRDAPRSSLARGCPGLQPSSTLRLGGSRVNGSIEPSSAHEGVRSNHPPRFARTTHWAGAVEHRPPITVALVDGEQLTRLALAQALSSSGLELVGDAETAEAGIELVVDVRPDVVLMDLQLPGMSGVRAIEHLGVLAPTSRVLVLTRSEQNRVVEAIVAGARGYILKSAPVEAIISAVKATAAGESVLSSKMAGKLLQRIRELDVPVETGGMSAVAIRTALTDRELEIFKRLASGKSNHEIARHLSLSPNTVANHVAGILAKLHLENRIQAAVEAVRSGIS
jgi:two-component system, NarL family, nitrate/nitrite response regulator NarL